MTAPRFAAAPAPAPGRSHASKRPSPGGPSPAPAAAPSRPRLEVVPDPSVLRRRRLTRLFTAIAGLAAWFGLFGVVSVHVLLAQGQSDVQRLRGQVQEQVERQQRLRMDVATLEAPARIVAAAENELGMTTPRAVIPLTPATLPPRP